MGKPREKPGYGLPLAVAAAWIVYAAVFFFWSGEGGRWQAFRWLLVPDQAWRGWWGENAAPLALFDRVPLVAAAAVILAAGQAWGRGALALLGVTRTLLPAELAVLAQGVGMSLVSTATLAVGLSGGLGQRGWIVPLLLGGVAALWLARLRGIGENRGAALLPCEPSDGEPDARETKIILACAVPFALALVWGGLLPPWDFDVREYHLQVPKEWHRQGAITFLPHNVYGNMPLAAEMFPLLAMEFFPGEWGWWQGALAGKLVMGCFPLLTAAALACAGRRLGSRLAGAAAATLYLATPGVIENGVAGLNEGAVAAFGSLAAFALWLGWNARGEATQTTAAHAPSWNGFVALSGLLAGAAAGCKYPGAVFIALPLGVVAVVAAAARGRALPAGLGERPWRVAWRSCLVFVLASSLGGGLWYAKNAVFTGNPVYPLAASWFSGVELPSRGQAEWDRVHSVPADATGSRWGPGPLVRSLASFVLNSPQLALMLWPLAGVALVARRWRRPAAWALGGAVLYWGLWWLFSHRLERFWLPALPLLALAAGLGFAWRPVAWWKFLARSLLALSLLAGGLQSVPARYAVRSQAELVWSPLPYLVPYADLRRGPWLVNPVHRYLNEQAGDQARVLLVGDAEPFDLLSQAVYRTCFDGCALEGICGSLNSAVARAQALREREIEFVYVHWGHIQRYRSPGNYGYSNWITQERMEREFVATGVLQRVRAPKLDSLDPWYGRLYRVQPPHPQPAGTSDNSPQHPAPN